MEGDCIQGEGGGRWAKWSMGRSGFCEVDVQYINPASASRGRADKT